MDAQYAIIAENLSKEYTINLSRIEEVFLKTVSKGQKIEVLKNFNFKIKKGSVTGIIGVNGSGKSTLLKILGQILKPDHGKIFINGTVGAIIELGAGFHPDLSGYDNIFFNATLHGFAKKDIQIFIDDIIDFSELHEFIHEPIKHYSSGMLMRLAFSIIIYLPFDILLLDEIFAVGDQSFKLKCMQKIKELSYSEKTILIVSHDFIQLKNICSELIFIHNHQVKMHGDINDVIESYIVNTNFLSSSFSFTEGEYDWQNPNKNQEIEHLSFYTTSHKYQFLNSEQIELNFKFKKKSDSKINIAVVFNSGIEQPFMAYSTTNKINGDFEIYSKGKYHLQTILPANFLNEGLILIDVHFIDKEATDICQIKSLAQLQIKKDTSDKDIFLKEKKFIGPIFPLSQWKKTSNE